MDLEQSNLIEQEQEVKIISSGPTVHSRKWTIAALLAGAALAGGAYVANLK